MPSCSLPAAKSSPTLGESLRTKRVRSGPCADPQGSKGNWCGECKGPPLTSSSWKLVTYCGQRPCHHPSPSMYPQDHLLSSIVRSPVSRWQLLSIVECSSCSQPCLVKLLLPWLFWLGDPGHGLRVPGY